MPRIPSPRSTQERRWRFLRVTALAGFTTTYPSPVPSGYQQLQGSYNGVIEGYGVLNPSYRQATSSPYRLITQPAVRMHQPSPTIPQETSQTSGELIAKPRNVSNSRLQPLLKWEPEQYAAIQAFIHERAREDLDISLSLKRQVESKLIELRSECSQRFPVLQLYQEDWVTLEFVRRFLKNSSSRS